jgi:DNA-binding transcriptional LysR family regulator
VGRTKHKGLQVTLEELRALEAVASFGSLSAAAQSLGKGHTGVLYALGRLEDATELRLLDRAGYRARLTPTGERFLTQARGVLQAERGLAELVDELRQGWEARLVADGILPLEGILNGLAAVAAAGAPTVLRFQSAFLGGVEDDFQQSDAQLMASVLPPQKLSLESRPLASFTAVLVAHRGHPVMKCAKKVSIDELKTQTLVTVRGGDPRLELSTQVLEGQVSAFHVNDFRVKKEVLLRGLGLGWMPEALIGPELKSGKLKEVRWERSSRHVFRPRLYARSFEALGPAARLFLGALSVRTQNAGQRTATSH